MKTDFASSASNARSLSAKSAHASVSGARVTYRRDQRTPVNRLDVLCFWKSEKCAGVDCPLVSRGPLQQKLPHNGRGMLPTAHAHASRGEVDEVRFSEPPHAGGFRFAKEAPASQPDGIDPASQPDGIDAAWRKRRRRMMSWATASRDCAGRFRRAPLGFLLGFTFRIPLGFRLRFSLRFL